MALLKDTAEPTTYLFALLGVWWLRRERTRLACGAFLCALLGRETALALIARISCGRVTAAEGSLAGPILAVLILW